MEWYYGHESLREISCIILSTDICYLIIYGWQIQFWVNDLRKSKEYQSWICEGPRRRELNYKKCYLGVERNDDKQLENVEMLLSKSTWQRKQSCRLSFIYIEFCPRLQESWNGLIGLLEKNRDKVARCVGTCTWYRSLDNSFKLFRWSLPRKEIEQFLN